MLAFLILGIQALTKSCATVSGSEDSLGTAMLRSIGDEARSVLYGQFMPRVSFMEENGQGTYWLWQKQIDCLMPLYGCLRRQMTQKPREDAEGVRTILLAEAGDEGGPPEETASPESAAPPPSEKDAADDREGLSDLLRAENEAALEPYESSEFVRHEKQTNLALEALNDYETLIRQFYTVDANTTAGSDQLDIGRFLEEDMSVSKEGAGPQILIYHTHSQEAFADSAPGDASQTIMGVGERLASILTEEYGYQVLHHLGQYDLESRNDSYAVALTDLEEILRAYPSIEVVIDLHRDEMPAGTRLAMDLDGRPTARFMFFNGLSRTKKTGSIAYLYNENLGGNLAFSFRMQKAAMEYYPNLTRKIYLKGYRYNMHLRPKSLLIELGAQNNTLEEAMNACDPLAHILDLVLSGQE